MREVFDKSLGRLADAVEIHSKAEWAAKLVFWWILLWPKTGIIWQHPDAVQGLLKAVGLSAGLGPIFIALWALSFFIFGFMFVKGADLLLPPARGAASPVASATPAGAAPAAKAQKQEKGESISTFDFRPKSIRFKRDEDPHVKIGDMLFTEKDLCTSVLITGVTGTGKTSAAVFPMLEQILSIYNDEGPGTFGKIGGLCLDVKGEFFEGMIYYMHRAGRNIFEDIQVIRPNCLMPVVRFKDPDTGYFFYLNAKPCSSGAESWDLIRGKRFRDGSEIPLNIFTFTKRKLQAYEPKLKEMVFDVGGKKINYLGWRWQGESLVRVTHTPSFNETHVALQNGRRIILGPPQKLVYEGVTFIDNALRYNIVEPHKPAPEAAMRLNLISTLAEGEKQSGENAYWYKRARAHIGSCIELWRAAYDETPQCTAQAIYKITQQDDYAAKQRKIVEGKIKALQEQLAGLEDFGDRVGIEREIERMTSIVKYFSEEWGKYDTKTKTIVGSVVANAFDTFNKDPVLQDSFCQPKTFSFEDCINEGKIFCLVAGDEYETVAKILGTALKMDFQSVVLSRMHRSELNQQRKIMLVNDECQKFVVAGGSQGAGDEHFMSLCRQSKCFNINATQADSWIISVVGKENSDVYLQNYNGRIWFRTNDKETAEKAEQLCGIKKQKMRTAGGEKPIHLENLLLGPKGSADHSPQFTEKEEEKPRYAKDKFYNLEMWECILFNGTRTGADKACQSLCEPALVTGDEGKSEVKAVMQVYFQGYLENLAYKQNGGRVFDHMPAPAAAHARPSAATPALEAPVPPAPAVASSAPPAPVPAAAMTVPPAPPPPAVVAPALPAIPELKTFGDAEALKARGTKLLKSVQVIPPRVATPAEGSAAPFKSGPATSEPAAPSPAAKTPSLPPQVSSQNTASGGAHSSVQVSAPPAAPTSAPAAPAAAGSNLPLPIPIVGKDFAPDNVTPRQLQAVSQNYQNNPHEAIQAALTGANFMPPVNPSEYLPAKQEEEFSRTGDPALAAEKAALGPNGLQGGNPNFALASGGAIHVPTPATNNFERAREISLKEERQMNAKSFVKAVGAKEGPAPDMDTLELLKDLKPETEENK